MLPSARAAVRIILLLAAVAMVTLLALEFLARPWTVQGRSMEPTLRAGDRVLVDLWTYRHRAPRTGEVVLLRGPAPEAAWMVKRVAPTPKPPRRRFSGQLWPGTGDPGGAGAVWLLGDAPDSSRDSREFGPVPLDRIVGRVVGLQGSGSSDRGFSEPLR